MDRRQLHESFYSSSVPIGGDASSKLLLRAREAEGVRFALDEAYRRDLHPMAVLRLKKNRMGVESRRSQGKSKKDSGAYEDNGASGNATRPKHFKRSFRSQEIPLFIKGLRNNGPFNGMEHGHYLYTLTHRFCLSCSGNRLVQQASPFISPLKQLRDNILSRCFGRGLDRLWNTGDFQYGSRRPVYLRGVCRSNFDKGDPV